MHTERMRSPGARFFFAAGTLLVLASPVMAQYGGFYQEPEDLGVDSRVSSPPPTPTPRRASVISLDVRGRDSAGSLIVAPGKRIGIRVIVRCEGSCPDRVTLAAMVLDDQAGIIAPSRGSVSGSGTWNTFFRAGEVEGSYHLLFVAQDPSGKVRGGASQMVVVQVLHQDPVLFIGREVLHPVPGNSELFTTHRSWRSAVALRTFTHRNWVKDEAEEILKNPDMHRVISEAVRLDRQRIGSSGKWPDQGSFRSYSHVESVMSRYWADAGLSLSAATANEVGNVFLAWRRGGMTVTLSEDVAASVGAGTRVVKVGRVLNAVGAAMICLDFWNNLSSAETPVEAREAWYKAGYGSVDLYLANVIGDTFGSAVALPGMFASYILNSSYDTLITGHKQCWFQQMVRVAAAEHYLGKDVHDTQAVRRVKAAMAGPKGLKGELMNWWLGEGANWDGWMGGCGSWSLAEARGYREAFVDRLLRTPEVQVDGVTYHPWSFYYSVSRMLVREQERKKALETAEHLRDLEAAYLQRLHDVKLLGRGQLLSGGGTAPPLKGAVVAPHAWRLEEGWRTDEDGNVTLRLRGDDLSPRGTLLLDVRTADRRSYLFLVPKSALTEVR